MKGSLGVPMQGIEIRKAKTFDGKKAVYCKDCKYLVYQIPKSKRTSKKSNTKKVNKNGENHPYKCIKKNIGLFYTSKLVCEEYEKNEK